MIFEQVKPQVGYAAECFATDIALHNCDGGRGWQPVGMTGCDVTGQIRFSVDILIWLLGNLVFTVIFVVVIIIIRFTS